jgi:predicted transcriptional regulator
MTPLAEPSPDAADEPTGADEMLALLEDDYSRAILEAINEEAMPANEVVEECDASRATVYRRLNRLEAAALVTSWLSYDADGHHRTVFAATLDAITVDLDTDGVGVTVTTDDGPAEDPVVGD